MVDNLPYIGFSTIAVLYELISLSFVFFIDIESEQEAAKHIQVRWMVSGRKNLKKN